MTAPARPLLPNRDFAIFWAGRTLSVLGDAFAFIALPLLVLQATGSILQMGLVTGIYGVGQFVTGLFAGELADRLDRRRLMIACDLSRCALYALIPLAWAVAGPQIALVYGVVVLTAILDMIFQVAYVTIIPNLVDHSQITAANARLSTTMALGYVIGPVLAGLLSAQWGAANIIGLNAGTFLISATSLALLRLRPPPPEPPGSPAPPGHTASAN